MSQGCGGGYRSQHFSCPLDQIPLYDPALVNQSFFYNTLGLEFKSFFETEGVVRLPMRVYRHTSTPIVLTNPGVDSEGRTFYQNTNVPLLFKAEPLAVANPRKIVVPLLVKVTSSLTTPALKGEVLLAVVTTHANEILENKVLINSSSTESAFSLYKIPGMPLIK